ncbi:PilW family protein [Microbacterium aurum]
MNVARRRPGDEGLTLIELLVAMGISSILIALITTMFVSTARSFGDQQGAVDNSRLASTAMNEVTRIVRAGTEIPVYGVATNEPVFEFAGSQEILLRSFIDAESSTDPAPLRVQFARNAANELVETRWTAYHDHGTYWKFNTTSTYARTVARSLLPPSAATPLFRYYDKSGTELVPVANASLTTAQIRNIASVQVTMQVQGDESGRVAPVTIQNMVGLPNLGVARVEVH